MEKGTDTRAVISYEEYSRSLIQILTQFEAPQRIRDGVIAMDQWITNDMCYKAPEARNSARDKRKLFDTFCSLDSATKKKNERQLKAAAFFEKHA